MDEPDVVLEGGPWGNPNVHYACTGARLIFPAPAPPPSLMTETPPNLLTAAGLAVIYYADSGRRTAEGRRVFVPEVGR